MISFCKAPSTSRSLHLHSVLDNLPYCWPPFANKYFHECAQRTDNAWVTKKEEFAGRLRPFQTSSSAFMESLICNVSDSCTLWTCFEGDSNPNRRIFCSTRSYAPMQTGSQGEASPFPLIDALITGACTQVLIVDSNDIANFEHDSYPCKDANEMPSDQESLPLINGTAKGWTGV